MIFIFYFLPGKPDLEDLLPLPSCPGRIYVQYRQGMSRVQETDAVYSLTPRQLCTLQSKKKPYCFFNKTKKYMKEHIISILQVCVFS